MAIYLVSYKPLCISEQGIIANERYKQAKFVDHSNRREPHLESPYPGISSICRAGKFAPRLEEDDYIVYWTVKGKHYTTPKAHRCIVAILRVIKKCNSHVEAAKWYAENNLPVPSNCLVEDSLPKEAHLTAYPCFDDEIYQQRVQDYPQYLICKPDFLNYELPPIITDEQIIEIFGYIPGTENPGTIDENHFEALRAITKKGLV